VISGIKSATCMLQQKILGGSWVLMLHRWKLLVVFLMQVFSSQVWLFEHITNEMLKKDDSDHHDAPWSDTSIQAWNSLADPIVFLSFSEVEAPLSTKNRNHELKDGKVF
jgi:hypothetical protein